MRTIDVAERRARLGRRHLLADPIDDLLGSVDAVVALHSSDPATVHLSARARVADFAVTDLEAALYEERSLVRVHGMRRTMFVVSRAGAALLDAGCAQAFVSAQRRKLQRMIAAQGLAAEPDVWLSDVADRTVAAIVARGEAVATDLRDDVPELRLKLAFGQGNSSAAATGLSTRVLFLLATEGRIVRAHPRGTWISAQYHWAAREEWLGGALDSWEPAAARAELTRRWLARFGPGTMRDLTWWSGWSKRNVVAALTTCGAIEVDLDGAPGYVLADDLDPVGDPGPWVALLPGLDSTPMGWKDRAWFVGSHQPKVFDRNGNIGPTIWSDGRIVGGWAQDDDARVRIELLEDVTSVERRRIDAEAAALETWLDGVRIRPRFPAPLDTALAQGATASDS